MYIYKFIYSSLLLVLFPFILIYSIFLSLKNNDFDYLKNRLGKITKLDGTNYLCIHCASLGEVNGAKELIKEIKKTNNVIISTNTYSGKIRASELFSDIKVIYFPLDYNFSISSWLKLSKIKSILIYETEIWPNFYKICGKKNIKLCIVNARIQKNLHQKKFIKKIYLEALENCEFIMCKSDYEKEKYLKLGIKEKSLLSVGNLKYSYSPFVIKDRDELNGGQVEEMHEETFSYFLMASTHNPDEMNFLQAIKELLDHGIGTVIAPRHIDRSKKIAKFFKDNGIETHFLSKDKNILGQWNNTGILILDTFGDLPKFYRNSKYVYVGGGYSQRGVQNIIEPSTYGKPIIVGPNIENFYEEIENLKQLKGITVIEHDKSITVQENITKNIRELHNLNNEALIKQGVIAKTYSLKFKNIVENYIKILKDKEIIN